MALCFKINTNKPALSTWVDDATKERFVILLCPWQNQMLTEIRSVVCCLFGNYKSKNKPQLNRIQYSTAL